MKKVIFLIVFVAVMIFSFVSEAGNARRPNYASDQTQIVGDNAVSAEVDTSGNLYVKERGSKAEDSAHTSGDYLTPIGAVRADIAASTAGATGDYCTPLTDSNGALYVNPRKSSTTVKAVCGDYVTTPKTIVDAGATGKKARVYRITIQSLAAEVFTLTEIPGLTTVNTAAGVPCVIDLGSGIVQTTAATAITAVTADTSSALIVTEVSYE